MTDLAKLAERYQKAGQDSALAYSNMAQNPDRVAYSANCLTIAAHLRDAAEREKAEAARSHYAARFADRVLCKSVPQQVRESIEEIMRVPFPGMEDYAPGDEVRATYNGEGKITGLETIKVQPKDQKPEKITLEATILERSNGGVKLSLGESWVYLHDSILDAARVKDEEKREEEPLPTHATRFFMEAPWMLYWVNPSGFLYCRHGQTTEEGCALCKRGDFPPTAPPFNDKIGAVESAEDKGQAEPPTDAKGSSIRIAPSDPHYGAHMSHCFDGGNDGCKYGQDEICPARFSPPVSSRAPAPARLREELAVILQRYQYNSETTSETVDRILDALIEGADLRWNARVYLRLVKGAQPL